MNKFKDYLIKVIENNSNFMEVCDIEQCENPNTKFPYKKYFTSLGEINLAKKILRILQSYKKMEETPKSYRDIILDYFGWHNICKIRYIRIIDHRKGTVVNYKFSYETIEDILNSIDYIDTIIPGEFPRFEFVIWTYDYWYTLTPLKIIKNQYTPKMPE